MAPSSPDPGVDDETPASRPVLSPRHAAVWDAERFRNLVEHVTDVVGIVDGEGGTVYVSPAIERLLGFAPDEMMGRSVFDFAHPDDLEATRRAFAETVDGAQPKLTVRARHKDGSWRWVESIARGTTDETGATVVMITARDITGQKLLQDRLAAQLAVARALAECRRLSDAAPRVLRALTEHLRWDYGGLWVVDRQANVLRPVGFWPGGPSGGEFTEQSRGMVFQPGVGLPGRAWVQGKPVWLEDVQHDANFSRGPAALADRLQTAAAFTFGFEHEAAGVVELACREHRRRDDDVCEMMATVGGQIGQFVERVRTAEERDGFFTLSVDMLCIVGQDGYFKRLNPAWEAACGFTLQELMSRPTARFVHPDDRDATRAALQQLAAGQGVVRFENRWLTTDGSYRWLSWACGGQSGMPHAFYAVARDVTEQKEHAEDLARTSAELEAIFRALPDLVFRMDRDGRIRNYHAGRAADLYARPEAFLGKRNEEVLPAPVGAEIAKAMARAHQDDTVASLEYEIDLAAGPAQFEARFVAMGDGGTLAFVRNVTERREAEAALKASEDKLHQAQRMEAVGRLAGGVAHDFNNLLMAILSYTRLLERRLAPDPEALRDVAEIRRAAERGAGLTKQLLVFGRRERAEPRALDLNAAVAGVEGMLSRLIGEHVQLRTLLAPELELVRVDPGQIEQVMVNLAVNARDAMPDGGALVIRTENVEIGEAEAAQHPGARSGPHVQLVFEDTGHGMDATTLASIFEPFFTTKERGKGTGLGLSTLYGIVEAAGGHVSVRSAPGHGSTFAVRLPSIPRATVTTDPSRDVAASSEPGGGSETICVVEDEDSVRSILVRALEHLGYRVLSAPHPRAAMEVLAAHGGPLHLLVTDVVMPGGSGPELAERILAAHPRCRVLYMSGYPDGGFGRQRSVTPPARLLEKPFDVDTLARCVRELLDQPR